MVIPLTANGRGLSSSRVGRMAIAVLAAFAATHAEAAPPKIRTDATNKVPACVTPKRLMAFIKTRNQDLDPRFADIASLYKKHGDAWHVRWDYAFFQMAVETNFLTYRRGNGDWGDVDPKQNNFAGLGTTGGGVPGDQYPDVSTGVLAQIQHLVVYSGEHIDNPVGARTRLKQNDIIETMASKRGSTTFSDLARRWAADRHYGASIEWVANSYRQTFCKGPDPIEAAEAPKQRIAKPAQPQQELARAANLGGPQPSELTTDARPPVRTVWSAPSRGDAASADSAPALPAPQRTANQRRSAPVPSRKPVVAATVASSEQIVSEQVFQTGEDPTPSAPPIASTGNIALNDAPPAAPSSTPQAAASPSPPQPVAFAYAAGLGSALPKRAASGTDTCKVSSASYGGQKILLVRAGEGSDLRFTVLTVLEGFEKSMLTSYLKAHAPGGSSVGEFASRDAALAKAREMCSRAASPLAGGGASAG